MGLIDSLFKRRRLAALEIELARAPRAEGYLELADSWLAAGQPERAAGALRAGLSALNGADALLVRYVALQRGRHADEVRRLRLSLEHAPTVEAYARLVAIDLDLDQSDRSLALCRAFRASFPKHEHAHRATGEIYLWRWRQDFLARDGARALEHLRRASDLDRGNLRCLRLLAETALQLGLGNAALRTLAAFELYAPGDGTVARLRAIAERLPLAGSEAEALAEVERSGHSHLDDPALLTPLAERAPVCRGLAMALPDAAERERVLDEVARLPGMRAALWFDEAGRTLGERCALGSTERWEALFAELVHAGGELCTGTDIGRMHRGQIDGPEGAIYLVRGRAHGFGAAFDPEGPRPEQLWSALERGGRP